MSSTREAKEKDWGVCVMNTNLNDIDGEQIEGSESPEEHGETVWQTMIAPAKASKVLVPVIKVWRTPHKGCGGGT